MLVIAHRGLTEHFPENSPGAIRAAYQAGADWVEIDVRTTADNALVLAHDPQIGELFIHESTLAELRRATVHSAVTTLEEGLASASGGVNLEIKAPCPSPASLALEIAELVGHRKDVLISSFWAPLVVEMRDSVELNYGLLSAEGHDPGGSNALAMAEDLGISTVVLQDLSITEAHAEIAEGLRLMAWDVRDPNRIADLSRWGFAGVIVDDVHAALKALGR